MDSLENKSPEELLALVDETEDKEVLRFIANEMEVSFSGNTGVGTLKEKLIPILTAKIEEQADSEDEDDPILQALKAKEETAVKATAAEVAPKPKRGILDLPRTRLAEMNPRAEGLKEVERRAIVRAKALRLHRVRVSNLDPADSAVPGAIISVYNKYTGKVSKFIPFGEENEYGYHIPEILLNELKSRTYNLRKEVKKRGNTFGVKEYRTVQMKKFSIEELPMLTKQELRDLGDDQKARGALDREVA